MGTAAALTAALGATGGALRFMRFAIAHTTRYRYGRAIQLGPHVFRMRPRCDGTQRVLAHRLRVQPRPVGWSDCVDLDGNAVAQTWFDVTTDSLMVIGMFTVETLRTNPYDFLISPEMARLPVGYTADEDYAVARYRRRLAPNDAVDAFAQALRREVDAQTVPFLGTLARRIAERSRPAIRLEGEPHPPAQTLREGTGACRDLTVLFIDCCRAVGLAARFVSGYAGGPTARAQRYLHAWAEVYLPGAGWRGFDPLQGLAAAEQHVAVAASAEPNGAGPIEGALRTGAVESRMETDVRIEELGADATGEHERSRQLE